ncbi:hypothetical protein ONE63_005815 [Megalurothrips usitatus]|uniref:Galactosylgalactosylxylosylprotein 3-beta-glucuronosyltransferase n=1 Tax=Megalurothrips usitatus TaxID=439358 RepID=A0AAV7XWQ6_9NEOP|nr:hypothetical protein ONE63_005815 [Megalurothrips usitatus]
MSTAERPNKGVDGDPAGCGGGGGGRGRGWSRGWRPSVSAVHQALQSSRAFRMWLVIWALTLLVVAQYSVSSAWLTSNSVEMEKAFEGLAAQPAQPARPPTAAPPPSSVTLDAIEEAVRLSVERLAQNDVMAASLGARLLREVASQLQIRAPTATPPPPGAKALPGPLPGRAPPPPGLPPLYVVTPTYRRPEQLAELTRMAQTLLLVRHVRWLVIEDAREPAADVARLLRQSGLPHEHLTAAMPEQYRKRRGAKPKGVAQRNRGLQWLRANASEGVFYFADDDNTYDVAIFEEIRTTRRVSMFPVGLCTKLGLSTPVVSSRGTFVGFYDGWVGGRKFPVDMAGFAVSVKFLHERPKAQMPFAPGFEEDGFLRSLAPFEPKEVELKADNCTKVLVWHTQTKINGASQPLDMKKFNDTNLPILKKIIV